MKKYLGFCVLSLGLSLAGFQPLAQARSGHSHNHDHGNDRSEAARRAAEGVFEDKDVKDRPLSDWAGIWQSVNPYLLSGYLDAVLKDKAKHSKDKTFEHYVAYYKKGYATDLSMIRIKGDSIEFYGANQVTICEYKYSGHKILTYKSGKKGVRYLFECNVNSQAPKYIQFSDHRIEPSESEHFHIFMGNKSHEELLGQMENWPTFYPVSLDKDGIVSEMLSH